MKKNKHREIVFPLSTNIDKHIIIPNGIKTNIVYFLIVPFILSPN